MRGYANGDIIKYIYICITLVQARSLISVFYLQKTIKYKTQGGGILVDMDVLFLMPFFRK